MSNPGKGWLVMVFVVLALFILGTFATPLFRARTSEPNWDSWCMTNLHQLGLMIDSYTREHQGRYPDPGKWSLQTMDYVKSIAVYKCHKADYDALRKYPMKHKYLDGAFVTSYAMNERLRGLSVKDVRKPEKTVLLFESTGEKLSGGPELVPKETRHEERRYAVVRQPYINVLFADGKIKAVPLDEVRNLKWNPN